MAPTFQEILAQYLTQDQPLSEDRMTPADCANGEAPPPQFSRPVDIFNDLFAWRPEFQVPRLKRNGQYVRIAKQSADRSFKPSTSSQDCRSQKPAERRLTFNELNPADQSVAHALIQMGAPELRDGISLSVLKKAHRRLVKLFHPDSYAKNLIQTERERRQAQFLYLQSAYARLKSTLQSPPSDCKTAASEA